MTKHLNHLRIASHEKERNWLKALIEVHNNHKSERIFDFGIRNAYANAYRIDVPEQLGVAVTLKERPSWRIGR